MGKVYIKTFGCQMNEYDSDKMADVLRSAGGMTPTSDPAEADVILINTCSVREKAQEKVFHDLGRLRPLKIANPELIIGVGGCVAARKVPPSSNAHLTSMSYSARKPCTDCRS